MKNYLTLLLTPALLTMGALGAEARDFALGGDISGTTELEAHGIVSYDRDGVQTENTRLMRQLGMNTVRLRVWVNPAEGFSSPQDVLVMARRAKEQGMDIMIDFHYSDWWADPGKQNPPAAWADMDLDTMCQALADHTRSTLQLLRDDGIDVRWVQIGNETSNGFLWPTGRADEAMDSYARLTTAGYHAAKEVYPEALMIVHLDNAYDLNLYRWMFDALTAAGTPFDMIGMSVYPYWSKRDPAEESSVTDVIDNIRYVSRRYHRPVMIVETGVEASKPELGCDFLTRLIDAAIDTPECMGVIYWAPESCHGGYPLGAFHDDRPTVILDAFTHGASRLADDSN